MRRLFTIILVWLSVNEIPAGVTRRTSSQSRQDGCDSAKSVIMYTVPLYSSMNLTRYQTTKF